MSNKRITDLTELTTPTTDDVFPVVDIATNTTTKVQLGNLPTTTAVTTALATKQDTLVSGTNIKTVNSISLVGSGNVAVQPTLVSGTNIKTLNSVSLLGSGDIVLAATPSGVSGAIQFSNGSAFASDAANLFWDNTNKRWGVGTNAPTATGHIVGSSNTATDYALKILNLRGQGILSVANDGVTQFGDFSSGQGYNSQIAFLRPSGATRATTFSQANQNLSIQNVNGSILFQNTPVQVIGSGSTSATTSLLVQNSSGLSSLQVTDDGSVFNYGKNAITTNTAFGRLALIANTTGSSNTSFGYQALFSNTLGSNNTSIGSRSLASNTSGDANTALGYQALFSNGSGSANVAVGQNALQGNTTGSNNVALGLNALFVTTGSSNTAVGNQSGNTITSGTGNLCLGFNAQPSSATANNECCFGSATVNAGAVSTESNSSSKVWNVIINGVAQKILLA